MTRDEIIKIAKEAWLRRTGCVWTEPKCWSKAELVRFAELIAAAEREKAIEATKQTLEPVAWMVYTLDGKSVCVTDNPADFTAESHRALPLYTTPPAREWVGLTDEEIWGTGSVLSLSVRGILEFARAVEAKLREKNT